MKSKKELAAVLTQTTTAIEKAHKKIQESDSDPDIFFNMLLLAFYGINGKDKEATERYIEQFVDFAIDNFDDMVVDLEEISDFVETEMKAPKGMKGIELDTTGLTKKEAIAKALSEIKKVLEQDLDDDEEDIVAKSKVKTKKKKKANTKKSK